jgi:hypothetical protein
MRKPTQDEAVRERMQELRCDIDEDVKDASEGACAMLDWRRLIKAHPWTCFGAAVALGYLIVRRRSKATCPISTPVAEPAPPVPPAVKPSPSSATEGMIGALLTTVAAIAVRRATDYLSEGADKLLDKMGHPKAKRP